MTEQDAQRVEMMLRTAKTKSELQELVRSLDGANVRLRKVRDDLATALAQANLNNGGNRR